MPPKRTNAASKRPTIYSLAKELGVTPGTVSRALRNRPEISAETRRVIRQKASEIGFKLRIFESRVTNLCAVMETIPNQRSLFSSYVDSVLDGIWRYCDLHGLELSIFGAEQGRLNNCELVRILGRRGVNGAIFLNSTKESRYFASLNKQNFPYCCVMSAPSEAREWTLCSEAEALGQKATEHLLHLGHLRIAYLDSLEGRDVGAERKSGYFRALAKAGINADPDLVITPKHLGLEPVDDFEFASQAVSALQRQKAAPTAFLAMSDEAGLALLRALDTRGIEVPKSVSVIAFDDSRLCAFTKPALTVVRVPYEEIGSQAAAIVHRRLESNEGRNTIPFASIGGELIIRESTGPAPDL